MYFLVGVMEIVIDWTMYFLAGVMEIVIETGPCTSLWG